MTNNLIVYLKLLRFGAEVEVYDIVSGIINGQIDISIEKMYLELTNRCNLHCKHCYNKSNDGEIYDIPKEVVIDLIDYSKEKGLTSIAYSGGEALLHPNIEEIFEYTSKVGLDMFLLTNGTYINEWLMCLLEKYKPILQISLEGPDQKTSDEIRGVGSFKKSIAFIEELKRKDYPSDIYINTVLNRHNINSYWSMKKFVKSLGVTSLSFSLLTNTGRAEENDLDIEQSEKIEVMKDINENMQTQTDFLCKGVGVNHVCSMNQVNDNRINIQPKVTPRGDVLPCQMHNGKQYMLGNVLKMTMSEIVNSEKTRAYLAMSQLRSQYMDACITCSFEVSCRRGCIAKAISEYHNPFSVDGNCYFYKKEFHKAFVMSKGGIN